MTPVKKAATTPHKSAKEAFKPAAPFKFADDFDWLVPDDYEVWIRCEGFSFPFRNRSRLLTVSS